MQNIVKLLILIAFILCCGCNDNQNTENKPEPVIVGLAPEYPPFEFQQHGKIVGFDVDLLQAIAKECGMHIQIQDMAFSNLIPALQTGKISMAISGFSITPERQKNIDFSTPYYHNSIALLYLKNKQAPHYDFSHKKIGCQLGSTMEKWAKKATASFAAVEIVSLDSNPPLIEKLKLKQIDYVVIETLQAIEFCKTNPQLSYQTVGKAQDGYGIALPKNSPLLPKINQALQALENNGTLKQLEDKWLKS